MGAKLADKIWEIAQSGELRKLNEFQSSEHVRVLKLFTDVWGAGPTTANAWYQQVRKYGPCSIRLEGVDMLRQQVRKCGLLYQQMRKCGPCSNSLEGVDVLYHQVRKCGHVMYQQVRTCGHVSTCEKVWTRYTNR